MNNTPIRDMAPGGASRGALFSLHYALYLFAWLTMWQGFHGEPTLFQLPFLNFPGLFLHESFLFYTFILIIIERVVTGDLTFSRSYFSGPILLMGFALVTSWMHGMFIRQQFSTVYEAHESIL